MTFWQDFRYGFRVLLKSPGFAIIAILTLALGIGANSTIFSWVNSTVLNPIPGVKHASEYAAVTIDGGRTPTPLSYLDYTDLRDRSHSLSSFLAASTTTMSLTSNGRPERKWGILASANYFDVLGVHPILGRSFLPSEDSKVGGAPVVVISYRLWQTHFAGDPSVIGQTLEIDRHQFQVAGVAPKGFVGTQTGLSYDLWVPIAMVGDFYSASTADVLLHDRGTNWLLCTGHLKSGVTIEQAQADLNVLMHQIAAQFPKQHTGNINILVSPLWRAPFGANYYLYTVLFILLAISGIVLLLACANVANLLLVRSVTRRREMAIRLSIGATRWRLVRQLLAESLILAVCGGGIAMLFTLWTAGSLRDFLPPAGEIPLNMTTTADRSVLIVTFALSILTGVIFGILPALRSSSLQPASVLKEEAGSASGGLHKARLSSILVVVQIAMSLLLLVCAGLFIRSVRQAQKFNPGFNPHHVLIDDYDLSGLGYDRKSGAQFHHQLYDKLQTIPGVQSATIADWIPLGFDIDTNTIQVEGYVPRPHESMEIQYADVGPHYLQTMQTPLLSGRDFTPADIDGSQRVAVVNAAFAERYWPHQQAIGKKLNAAGTWYTVVGVAQNSDYHELGAKPEPFFYLPLFQDYDPSIVIYARVAGDPLAFVSSVQDAVHSLDADLPLFDLATLDSRIDLSTTTERIASTFVGGFGILALILAGIGIYGVLAYTTRQRTHEIGIRMALGAEPRDVLRLVLRQGLTLAAVGLTLGLAGSFALARALAHVLSRELFGISSTDPLTFAAVAVLLLFVAFLACFIPARRAMRTDPMVALRYE
ncbi:MAG TPA: ABC transporter permease [Candidatus Acidoferrales bacterium]|nr:ABC transporter permease [Candidatus Acidoferrales bacterium]